jgi:NAD(P)H-hydrate repair Nnr-like enzyme with NAD(P)H-hydrate epimerase domain
VSGRLRSLGVALGAALALAGAIITACYEIPEPSCGFLCGPGGACPDGYRCAADMYCHRNDTPPDRMCTRPDAPLPADATSADAAADAAPDARGDDAGAAIDAPDDAAPDAAPDAAIDAAIDAPP